MGFSFGNEELDGIVDKESVLKEGVLTKMGGGDGGRKNWKKRYFVFAQDLHYYEDQEAFDNGEKPKGSIKLDAYFVAENKASADFEFTLHAYPKNMTCRAASKEDMQGWIKELHKPLL